MTSGPATREFRNEVIRITELTVVHDAVEGYSFSNSEVVGPAVLLPVGSTSFVYSSFDAPDADALFWPIARSRAYLTGVVQLIDCNFSGCRFRRIGLAMLEDQIDSAREGFGF